MLDVHNKYCMSKNWGHGTVAQENAPNCTPTGPGSNPTSHGGLSVADGIILDVGSLPPISQYYLQIFMTHIRSNHELTNFRSVTV